MNRLHTMNFVEKLFIQSINHMKTDNWEWPDNWDSVRKEKFLDESLEYAVELELYEQCAIIRDVQKTIN
jgi:protein-arginine kinase activator protein McsA